LLIDDRNATTLRSWRMKRLLVSTISTPAAEKHTTGQERQRNTTIGGFSPKIYTLRNMRSITTALLLAFASRVVALSLETLPGAVAPLGFFDPLGFAARADEQTLA